MYFDRCEPLGLKDYQAKFISADLDETRHYISNAIRPHNLSIIGRKETLSAKIGKTQFGYLNFIYIKHGANVNVSLGDLETLYLLQIPVGAGGHRVFINGSDIHLTNNMAYIVSPSFDLKMRFTKNCGNVVMTVERDHLCRYLEQILQHRLRKPLEFDPGIPFSPSTGHELTNLVTEFTRQLKSCGSSLWQPFVQNQAEQLLLSTMLFGLRHNYTEELFSGVAIPRPRYIKWAQEYVHANAESPMTPDDLASEACVSRRSLFAGFKSYLQCTPMAYVRDVKLNRIRGDLVAGNPIKDSVSQVAMKYSVFHFSNFAANYKRKFGESPSETLRKTKTG